MSDDISGIIEREQGLFEKFKSRRNEKRMKRKTEKQRRARIVEQETRSLERRFIRKQVKADLEKKFVKKPKASIGDQLLFNNTGKKKKQGITIF